MPENCAQNPTLPPATEPTVNRFHRLIECHWAVGEPDQDGWTHHAILDAWYTAPHGYRAELRTSRRRPSSTPTDDITTLPRTPIASQTATRFDTHTLATFVDHALTELRHRATTGDTHIRQYFTHPHTRPSERADHELTLTDAIRIVADDIRASYPDDTNRDAIDHARNVLALADLDDHDPTTHRAYVRVLTATPKELDTALRRF